MARTIKPLTASQVEKAKPIEKEYNLFDGDGLYLVIRSSGTKTWMLRIKDNFGKVHKLKLGTFPEITLAFARERRVEYKRAIAEGKDLDEVLGRGEHASRAVNSLEVISRAWLEQYAKRKPLEEHTKHKRIRKLENHLFRECHFGLDH